MPNFTTPIPPKLSGDANADIGAIKKWGTALIDELTYLFNNLDSGNVIEAREVRAENINTSNAKITNAQIGALTADKLKAGSVDTNLVTVEDKDGKLTISGSEIVICDDERERFAAAYDKESGSFRFVLYNADGNPTVSIDSSGDAHFGGVVESSRIFSSTIVGTDIESYAETDGGVFAQIDQKGIKVMQDKEGSRLQKIGMSVADDGTAYLVLGAGNGEGKQIINGIEYTNGAFKIEKNDTYTNMGLVGGSPFVYFWDSGELGLSGDKVTVNGRNILNELDNISSKADESASEINRISSEIEAMNQRINQLGSRPQG